MLTNQLPNYYAPKEFPLLTLSENVYSHWSSCDHQPVIGCYNHADSLEKDEMKVLKFHPEFTAKEFQ